MQNLPGNLKKFRPFFLLFSVCFTICSAAQNLTVIQSRTAYQSRVTADSLQAMVPVAEFIPAIVIDLRYVTNQNFTGKKLYKRGAKAYLRLPAARALQAVAAEIANDGYSLKLWDAYRPYAVTQKMWELIGDERYVANPAKGSGHNRGLAVDLTLLKDGGDVDMGTGFDNFSDTAHHAFTNLPAAVLQNRTRLKTVMEKHGFRSLATEWWHYSWPNDRSYDVLNVPFKKLSH